MGRAKRKRRNAMKRKQADRFVQMVTSPRAMDFWGRLAYGMTAKALGEHEAPPPSSTRRSVNRGG
jgi:hypothetical protein